VSRSNERSGGGLSIAGRFSLFMTLALLVVMTAAGFFLLDKSRDALKKATGYLISEGAAMTAAERDATRDLQLAILREVRESEVAPDLEIALVRIQANHQATFTPNGLGTSTGHVRRFPVLFKEGSRYAGWEGVLVETGSGVNLLFPADPYGGQGDSLFGLILMASAMVIAVGAGVAFGISSQVTKPIELLVDDVRSIARGNLLHKTRVRSGGEVQHLARQIDRMAQSLDEAQGAEVELGVREREREVAQEVRGALLPSAWPDVAGYGFGDLHVDSAEPGGDFHDFVSVDGKLVLFVCEVSGRGVPGALVGATARAYLKNELERGGDLTEALRKINRVIARDVRRGMYVTALVVVLDPAEHSATVACAGHKLPLVRWEAESSQVRLVQPGGIALGFDKGPVFDRSLELAKVALAPGDRLVLATTGPVQVANPDGEELGEKRFYRLIARNSEEQPKVMLDGILTAVEAYADGEEFPADLSLVILARD
jgi:serine phosphatase RsbU (regulator of sigma subunit)